MPNKQTQLELFAARGSTYHETMLQNQIEATKFYIRHREGYPETELMDYSRRGFWTLGIETQPFEWVDDIDNLTDLSPTVGVSGYIGDIHKALNKLNIPIPQNIDYPDQLKGFLGREIKQTTLGEIRKSNNPKFIKPDIEHKLFNGFVWTGDENSRRKIVTCSDETTVWASEPISIASEFRVFILDGEILDCRRYKGDWQWSPNALKVKQAVSKMQDHSPRAYCLDFGVTNLGETILVEMNEGFYG